MGLVVSILHPFGCNFAIHALYYTRWGKITTYSRQNMTRISGIIASLAKDCILCVAFHSLALYL